MIKWEYKVIYITSDASTAHQAALETLGQLGWELVAVTPNTENTWPMAYLKRPAPSENQPKEGSAS
jgi:hypothetical protein